MSHTNVACLLLLALFVAGSPRVHALQSDKEQPIQITADRAERDEKIGLTSYHGHVEIRQGTLFIEAEHVVIKTPVTHGTTTEEIEEITASGKPTHFHQQINEQGESVDASATTVHYRVHDKLVDLVNGAMLKQEGRILSGENISYDIGSQRVTANSGSDTAADGSTPTERVTVIIPPRPHKEKTASGDSSNTPETVSPPVDKTNP